MILHCLNCCWWIRDKPVWGNLPKPPSGCKSKVSTANERENKHETGLSVCSCMWADKMWQNTRFKWGDTIGQQCANVFLQGANLWSYLHHEEQRFHIRIQKNKKRISSCREKHTKMPFQTQVCFPLSDSHIVSQPTSHLASENLLRSPARSWFLLLLNHTWTFLSVQLVFLHSVLTSAWDTRKKRASLCRACWTLLKATQLLQVAFLIQNAGTGTQQRNELILFQENRSTNLWWGSGLFAEVIFQERICLRSESYPVPDPRHICQRGRHKPAAAVTPDIEVKAHEQTGDAPTLTPLTLTPPPTPHPSASGL